MYALPEVIANKVIELLGSIQYAKDDLQIECAEVSLNGDFSRLVLLSSEHGYLQELETNIISVLKNHEHNKKTRSNVKSNQPVNRKHHTKTSGKHLRVTLAGKVIEGKIIGETFVKVFKIIGFDRVIKLNKKTSKIALFSKTPTTGYQTQQYVDGWYITTHFSNDGAKLFLENIANELNIPIRVEIV
ncbi:hypothetical protein BCS42_15880 [Crenothrix sp. D3]|nr:hypothetical protein BCS42_15880 [Crenothrix sp. D3]